MMHTANFKFALKALCMYQAVLMHVHAFWWESAQTGNGSMQGDPHGSGQVPHPTNLGGLPMTSVMTVVASLLPKLSRGLIQGSAWRHNEKNHVHVPAWSCLKASSSATCP